MKEPLVRAQVSKYRIHIMQNRNFCFHLVFCVLKIGIHSRKTLGYNIFKPLVPLISSIYGGYVECVAKRKAVFITTVRHHFGRSQMQRNPNIHDGPSETNLSFVNDFHGPKLSKWPKGSNEIIPININT